MVFLMRNIIPCNEGIQCDNLEKQNLSNYRNNGSLQVNIKHMHRQNSFLSELLVCLQNTVWASFHLTNKFLRLSEIYGHQFLRLKKLFQSTLKFRKSSFVFSFFSHFNRMESPIRVIRAAEERKEMFSNKKNIFYLLTKFSDKRFETD